MQARQLLLVLIFTWLAGPGDRDPVPRLLLLAEQAILEGNLEGQDQ